MKIKSYELTTDISLQFTHNMIHVRHYRYMECVHSLENQWHVPNQNAEA